MAVLTASFFALLLAAAPAKAPNLAGTWRGGGFEIVLKADGSGTIKDSEYSPAEPLKWKASANALTITEEDEPVAYSFKQDGDRLHLSGGDLDEPVDLVRGAASAKASSKVDPQAAPGSAAKHVGPGSCDGACRHYLKCAGQPALQAQCVLACYSEGYGADFMGWFQSLDCVAAITVIAMLEAQSRGLQGGGGGGASQSKECEGCRWDGSSCAWYSQGNWGSNVAYSGAVITCNSSCCGR
ncbi:MAG: hypothetical protein HY901_14135 [Deltaproteobacteria bacterium]|nr:hypothetical protein [Deltaproteobacteria bacterium]